MRTIIRFLAVPALVAGLGLCLRADDAPAVRGQVLLLRSERGLEGEIEKAGDRYRIRRGAGESWVACDQAVRLCADWDEAYHYMQARANLADPDERLRLARWCQVNGLDAHALEEAHATLQLRPNQPEARRLVQLLERRPPQPTAPASPPPAPAPAPARDVDLSPESLVAFKTRVQPILMNACVACHAGTHAGSFRLYRVTEGGQHDTTRRNLAAVLGLVNLEQAAVSPLLIKAASPHGGAKAWPIKNREAPAYQSLQAWVEQTAATNPHLRAARAPAPPRLASEFVSTAAPVGPASRRSADDRTGGTPVPPEPAIVSRPLERADAPPPQLPPLPAVAEPQDEYSAERFNQQMHPAK